MGKAIRASVLVLVLACSARAGYIHNDAAPTPPPPAITEQESIADGEIQNDAAGSLTETVLNLLGSVLALF